MSAGKRDYLSMLWTSLVFLIMNSMAKTKLAILPFVCFSEIGKNSIERNPFCENIPVFVNKIPHKL